MNTQITSLDAHGDILYTGLENGLILCLKCVPDISVSMQFSAYNRAVSSLMVMKPPDHNPLQPVPTSRTNHYTEKQREPRSAKDSPHSPTSKTLQALVPRRNKRQVSLDITPGSFKVTSSYQTAQNVLLMSLGKAHTGITGSHENHPEEFILPSVGLQTNKKPAKAKESSSHLLIWSTEICDLAEGEMMEDDFEAQGRRISEEVSLSSDDRVSSGVGAGEASPSSQQWHLTNHFPPKIEIPNDTLKKENTSIPNSPSTSSNPPNTQPAPRCSLASFPPKVPEGTLEEGTSVKGELEAVLETVVIQDGERETTATGVRESTEEEEEGGENVVREKVEDGSRVQRGESGRNDYENVTEEESAQAVEDEGSRVHYDYENVLM